MTYSEDLQQVILNLVDQKMPWTKIAEAVGKKPDAIRQWVKRRREANALGVKPIITKRTHQGPLVRALKSITKNNRSVKLVELPDVIKRDFPAISHVPSTPTLRKILTEIGIELRPARLQQFISGKNKEKRLEFAQKYVGKGDRFWSKVVWSDETMVRKAPRGQKVQFWQHHGDSEADAVPNYQFQQGGFGVMFWGCFTADAFGPLVVVEGSMDQVQYARVLDEHLLPWLGRMNRRWRATMTFMQDNAPCHKSKAMMAYFAQKDIPLMPWPAQSPDLNPIENLWAIVKQRRKKKYGVPLTKADLIEQTLDIWNSLEPELAQKLADSAIKRLQKCIEQRGGHTGY